MMKVTLKFTYTTLIVTVLLIVAAITVKAQKSTSVVIHDATSASAGGEGATSNLRNEIKAALEREKPCVETMDDQDLRDAINDERERVLLEGGDSTATLKAIGEKLGAGVVIVTKSLPGAGGASNYSVFAANAKTGQTLDRQSGNDSSARSMAESLVGNIGSNLADQCKPHWVGTISSVYTFSETRTTSDKGAMRAASRNTKRTLTEASTMTDTIKATLMPPKDDKSVNSPSARVSHRTSFVFMKKSSTSGELYCRVPNRNPFWKGFSEDFSETTTQLGQGTDLMPVTISFDSDGTYTIQVAAPAGVLYGKVETDRTGSGCGDETEAPKNSAVSMPEGRLQPSSVEATGTTTRGKATSLAGSQTSPDGRTKISWNLRLVKPKGK